MNDEIKEYVIKFHNTYEKLAPNYDYETRKDTKELDFNSNNGKLMYATINEIITPLLDDITNLQQENEKLLSENIAIKSVRNMVDETIYKSRCEKAVEYIKNCPEYLWANVNTRVLLNILNGKGEE